MYITCEYCGAHLDHGETCECRSDSRYDVNLEETEESEDKKEPVTI